MLFGGRTGRSVVNPALLDVVIPSGWIIQMTWVFWHLCVSAGKFNSNNKNLGDYIGKHLKNNLTRGLRAVTGARREMSGVKSQFLWKAWHTTRQGWLNLLGTVLCQSVGTGLNESGWNCPIIEMDGLRGGYLACKPTCHGNEAKPMVESAQDPIYIKGRKASAAQTQDLVFPRLLYECLDSALLASGIWRVTG